MGLVPFNMQGQLRSLVVLQGEVPNLVLIGARRIPHAVSHATQCRRAWHEVEYDLLLQACLEHSFVLFELI